MAKRGAVRILNEKRKRQFNKYWDWDWTDQFRWCRPKVYAQSLREKLEEIQPKTHKEKIRLDIAKGFLRIAAEGLSNEVQGQPYDVWDTILEALGFTAEHKKVLITEFSDRTGEYNPKYDLFELDWNAIREGNGLVLCGAKTMKVRWEVLHRWVAHLLSE
ncbi:hypothetical protein J7J18_01725 [bacterium]|nr:hypothetical protein [bacterium]